MIKRFYTVIILIFCLLLLSFGLLMAKTDHQSDIEDVIRREWSLVTDVSFRGSSRNILITAELDRIDWEEDVRGFFDSYFAGTCSTVFEMFPEVQKIRAKVYGHLKTGAERSERLLIYRARLSRDQAEAAEFDRYGYAEGFQNVTDSWLHHRYN